MSNRPAAELRLEPETEVDIADGQTVATSSEPWFRVAPVRSLSRRRWVRLRYSSSYFDDPVRPIIRFDTVQGRRLFQFMNRPVLGTGEWIGRIPDRTTAISISPTNRLGPFAFQLLSVETLSRRALVRRGLTYDRSSLLCRSAQKLSMPRKNVGSC